MSSIQNDRDVAKISDALQKQHLRIHINELRRPSTTAPGSKGKGRGSGNKWRPGNGRGKYKSSSYNKNKAFHSVDTEIEEDEYDEDDPGDEDDPSAYLANPAHESEEDYESEAGSEDGQESTAFLASEESKMDDEEIECLNAIAYYASTFGEESLDDHASLDAFVDTQLNAFAAFKSKGKSKGRGRLRPSKVSLQDRRDIMAKMKARSNCRKCGRRGHWEGDKECPMNAHIHILSKGQ